MANLDVIMHPIEYVILFGIEYWYLPLGIAAVVISTILILKKKKKQQQNKEEKEQ